LAVPEPRVAISIRLATMEDIPALDALQKKHGKALGFFPRAQMEGYVRNQWILIAEEVGSQKSEGRSSTPVGYCASRDRYLKRDELGIIYQLCVAPGVQRKLVGAALVREVFARSAYGCRLYCCWCAQDLAANHFWEAMGFAPIAFRAGGKQKKNPSTGLRAGRVHIFWQKRIVEGDTETKWWYPSQTNQGAIREDRLVFPIPPGTHWTEVQAVAVSAGSPKLEGVPARRGGSGPGNRKSQIANPTKSLPPTRRYVQFGSSPRATAPVPVVENPRPAAKRPPRPAAKIDPALLAKARELRDRYLEEVNSGRFLPPECGKYDVSRQIEDKSAARAQANPTHLLDAA
jgi:hypothetical protein